MDCFPGPFKSPCSPRRKHKADGEDRSWPPACLRGLPAARPGRWGAGERVEVANEVVGPDRWGCLWRRLRAACKPERRTPKPEPPRPTRGLQARRAPPLRFHPRAGSPSILRPRHAWGSSYYYYFLNKANPGRGVPGSLSALGSERPRKARGPSWRLLPRLRTARPSAILSVLLALSSLPAARRRPRGPGPLSWSARRPPAAPPAPERLRHQEPRCPGRRLPPRPPSFPRGGPLSARRTGIASREEPGAPSSPSRGRASRPRVPGRPARGESRS